MTLLPYRQFANSRPGHIRVHAETGNSVLRQTRLSGGSNREAITDFEAIGPQSRHTQKAPRQRSIANGPYHRRTHTQNRLRSPEDAIQNTWRREGAKASSTAQLGKVKCLQAALVGRRSHQHRKGKRWKEMTVFESKLLQVPLSTVVYSALRADVHETV